LLTELCPSGVEFKQLVEISVLENTGVDKKIIVGQKKVKLLNYMDVYRNKHINKDIIKMEVSATDAKIKSCNIEKGDIFITPTSETIDDIGHASVADEDITDSVYSYHVMRIRLNHKNTTTPYYIRYLFESDIIQNQILKLATGMTRFGLKKGRFESIKVPLPPLLIQEEIVKILDGFTELEAELEAELELELEARKKQYEYYKEELFSFTFNLQHIRIKDICDIGDGLHGTPNYNDSGSYYFINGNNLKEGKIIFDSKTKRVDDEVYSKNGIIFVKGKTVFMSINGTIGSVSHFNNEPIVLGKSVAYFNVKSNLLDSTFLFYFLKTKFAKNYFETQKTGATIKNLGLRSIREFKIPLPSITEQRHLVTLLNKFETIVYNISNCLPAELSARRSQYEYYRGKLLTFKEYVKQ